jgi:hypothetical protein
MDQDPVYDLNQVSVMGSQEVPCIEFRVSIGTVQLPIFTAGHYFSSDIRSLKRAPRDGHNTAQPVFAFPKYDPLSNRYFRIPNVLSLEYLICRFDFPGFGIRRGYTLCSFLGGPAPFSWRIWGVSASDGQKNNE